jgi:hypothetical protein
MRLDSSFRRSLFVNADGSARTALDDTRLSITAAANRKRTPAAAGACASPVNSGARLPRFAARDSLRRGMDVGWCRISPIPWPALNRLNDDGISHAIRMGQGDWMGQQPFNIDLCVHLRLRTTHPATLSLPTNLRPPDQRRGCCMYAGGATGGQKAFVPVELEAGLFEAVPTRAATPMVDMLRPETADEPDEAVAGEEEAELQPALALSVARAETPAEEADPKPPRAGKKLWAMKSMKGA